MAQAISTAPPWTRNLPSAGMSMVSLLGRPTWLPWRTSTRLGGSTSESSRRYPPKAAAAEPVAGIPVRDASSRHRRPSGVAGVQFVPTNAEHPEQSVQNTRRELGHVRLHAREGCREVSSVVGRFDRGRPHGRIEQKVSGTVNPRQRDSQGNCGMTAKRHLANRGEVPHTVSARVAVNTGLAHRLSRVD
jgi:hypothetical protein